MQGDADADLDVDGADFLIWQLGMSKAVTATTAVPESDSLQLTVLAASVIVLHRLLRAHPCFA